MASTESLLNISFNVSLSKYGGDIAVGAMTILSSAIQMCTITAGAISQGAQPIISFNFGARKFERVRKAVKLMLITNTTYTTIFFISAQLFAPSFVRIFSSDPELMELTTWALRIYLGGTFMMGIQNGCQNSFLALGQAKISLFLACLRKLILLIPLIYILPMFFEDKLFAVFLAEPVSDILAATCTLTAFLIMFPKILKNAGEVRS
ncbi:MAG: MATE family efflux transporter [Lachnospiraceae bacterium]